MTLQQLQEEARKKFNGYWKSMFADADFDALVNDIADFTHRSNTQTAEVVYREMLEALPNERSTNRDDLTLTIGEKQLKNPTYTMRDKKHYHFGFNKCLRTVRKALEDRANSLSKSDE